MYLYNQLDLFQSAYVSVNIQLIRQPAVTSSFLSTCLSHELHVTRDPSLAYAVTNLPRVILSPLILLLNILLLDRIMKSELKRKNRQEAKKSCKDYDTA